MNGAESTRERAVPCRGFHSMARRPMVWADDAYCAVCRDDIAHARHDLDDQRRADAQAQR